MNIEENCWKITVAFQRYQSVRIIQQYEFHWWSFFDRVHYEFRRISFRVRDDVSIRYVIDRNISTRERNDWR